MIINKKVKDLSLNSFVLMCKTLDTKSKQKSLKKIQLKFLFVNISF